jgi:hypothetical protein
LHPLHVVLHDHTTWIVWSHPSQNVLYSLCPPPPHYKFSLLLVFLLFFFSALSLQYAMLLFLLFGMFLWCFKGVIGSF